MENRLFINAADVLRQAFRYLDPRLVYHGERVAYILKCLLNTSDAYSPQEKQDIFMLGLLHDIGAYRTEDIDTMVSFDVPCSMEHCIYGYLLLKHFSPLSEYAECILYHHCYAGHAEYYAVPISHSHRKLAKLLFLADRIDIFVERFGHKAIGSFRDIPAMKEAFSPDEFSFFLERNRTQHIAEKLDSGAYQKGLDDYIKSQLRMTDSAALEYLTTFLLSLDFRNEFTAFHMGHAMALSRKYAKTLQLPESSRYLIEPSCALLCIGRVFAPADICTAADYGHFLSQFYQTKIRTVTRKILEGNVSPTIIETIRESYELMDCIIYNRPISHAPTPVSEVIALSYLSVNNLGRFSGCSLLQKEQLTRFLTEKYRRYGLNTSMLSVLLQNYSDIMLEAGQTNRVLKSVYQSMVKEYHSLETILSHYNPKYSVLQN